MARFTDVFAVAILGGVLIGVGAAVLEFRPALSIWIAAWIMIVGGLSLCVGALFEAYVRRIEPEEAHPRTPFLSGTPAGLRGHVSAMTSTRRPDRAYGWTADASGGGSPRRVVRETSE